MRTISAPPSTPSTVGGFACEACSLFYALDDGLPNMLIDEARAWPLATAPTASSDAKVSA